MPAARASLLDEGAERLRAVTTSPVREARWLLAHALGIDRPSDLHLSSPAELSDGVLRRYEALVAERARGVPLQYVMGHADFYESRFDVGPGVFIPRPETEVLVQTVVDAMPACGRVLDLGTGTGAIVLSVLLAHREARGAAVDRSPAALDTACRNAVRLGVAGRVTFHEGDLFDALPVGAPFDVIVSNPPYVATGDEVAPDVLAHEPHAALYAGADGLDVIRRIISGAPERLVPGGVLALEMGETQGPEVRDLLTRTGYERIEISRDLTGRERIAHARWGAGRAERGE